MNYYNLNYKEYIEKTKNIDMLNEYQFFLKYFNGKDILDIGFGSCRDISYFKNLGYNVKGIEKCIEFYNYAKELNYDVRLLDVLNLNDNNLYDGIWASAIINHLNDFEIKKAFNRIHHSLKPNGIVYFSYKDLYNSKNIDRYYNFKTKEELFNLINKDYFVILDYKYTNNLDASWHSFILKKL